MLREIQTGHKVTARKYNQLVSAVRRLISIRGTNGITVTNSPAGITIVGTKIQAQAGLQLTKARIIHGVTYPDPTVDPTSPLYFGYNHYKVRLTTSAYEEYDNAKEYIEPDKVHITRENDNGENKVYTCISTTAIVGIKPEVTSGWESYWELDPEIIIDRAIGNEVRRVDYDLRNYVPWYKKDEVVPVIKIVEKYYIWQTLTYTGIPSAASIRYNDTGTGRTMAVFK